MDAVPQGLTCPACKVDLVMSERQGIEIDYCPRCRGVWLDRGELDKIVERNSQEQARLQQRHPGDAREYQQGGRGYRRDHDDDDDDRFRGGFGGPGGFLGRLFD